jgi:hypothetical protein
MGDWCMRWSRLIKACFEVEAAAAACNMNMKLTFTIWLVSLLLPEMNPSLQTHYNIQVAWWKIISTQCM